MSITAMKQAVATLKGRLDHPDASDTIASLLAAIAEEEACVPVLCVSSRSFARMRAGDDRINAWLPPATEAEDMPLYTTPQPAPKQEPIPPGYQLVPLEPTDKMVQASLHLDLSYMPLQEGYDRAAVYKAMLAAAPVQAQEQRKPLTDDEINRIRFAIPTKAVTQRDFELARAIESAHNIKEQP